MIAIIGDVGGHLTALKRLLHDLGVDTQSARLPDDLTIVQVGDLVHRGPDSAGAVRLAARMIANHGPDRWVQLLGNHEAVDLGQARWDWSDRVDHSTRQLLDTMWESGAMRLAAGLQVRKVLNPTKTGDPEDLGSGPLLITHAGLTAGCWRALGGPSELSDVVDVICRASSTPLSPVWERGQMTSGRPSWRAGVLWASTGEMHGSWAEIDMPWSQVHGHMGARRTAGKWHPPLDALHRNAATRSRLSAWDDQGITRVQMPNRRLVWGVDPGHGARTVRPWGPLLLDGEILR